MEQFPCSIIGLKTFLNSIGIKRDGRCWPVNTFGKLVDKGKYIRGTDFISHHIEGVSGKWPLYLTKQAAKRFLYYIVQTRMFEPHDYYDSINKYIEGL